MLICGAIRPKRSTYFGLSMLIENNAFMPLKCSLSPLVLRWLTYQDSLTANLQVLANNVSLQILSQGWKGIGWWDNKVLNLTGNEVFIREILMSANKEPCWYARTIIPDITYKSAPDFFNRLGKESLNMLIFNETKVKREKLSYYAISNQTLEYYWLSSELHNNQSTLWVRISSFVFNKKFPFYLIEILLPAIERYDF